MNLNALVHLDCGDILVHPESEMILRVTDIDAIEDPESENMSVAVKLIEKHGDVNYHAGNPNSWIFDKSYSLWLYADKESVDGPEMSTKNLITLEDLVLVSPKTAKTENVQNNLKPHKVTKPSSRRLTIGELRELSHLNNLDDLIDKAYDVLKESALKGDRKVCLSKDFDHTIQHFIDEGFEVVKRKHFTEIRW